MEVGDVRRGVEADDVADRVGVDGLLAAEREPFVVGLRDHDAALVVLFVPGLWRGRKGEGCEREGEEEKGEAGHFGRVVCGFLSVCLGSSFFGLEFKFGVGGWYVGRRIKGTDEGP